MRQDTAIAFLAAATEQLQLAVRLLVHNPGAALASLEKLVAFCEEHPQHAREWPQFEVLSEIVGAVARTGLPASLSARAANLMCRIEELNTKIH